MSLCLSAAPPENGISQAVLVACSLLLLVHVPSLPSAKIKKWTERAELAGECRLGKACSLIAMVAAATVAEEVAAAAAAAEAAAMAAAAAAAAAAATTALVVVFCHPHQVELWSPLQTWELRQVPRVL
ncbi:hypothetical protein DFJ73DRAFT_769524 [Zopfochytrium polystomum]|nr:hypothetical protein DFJ73DRAFT_769524 [Zopfochytrium polystomum]